MKYRKYPNWVIITNKEIPFPYTDFLTLVVVAEGLPARTSFGWCGRESACADFSVLVVMADFDILENKLLLP
jgi:hypothetical protein